MIIKNYKINNYNKNMQIFSDRELNMQICQLIYDDCMSYSHQNNTYPCIFTNYNVYRIISDSQFFVAGDIYDNIEFVGTFRGFRIYLNLKMTDDETILGKYSEVISFLNKRIRKEKLVKINNY